MHRRCITLGVVDLQARGVRKSVRNHELPLGMGAGCHGGDVSARLKEPTLGLEGEVNTPC